MLAVNENHVKLTTIIIEESTFTTASTTILMVVTNNLAELNSVDVLSPPPVRKFNTRMRKLNTPMRKLISTDVLLDFCGFCWNYRRRLLFKSWSGINNPPLRYPSILCKEMADFRENGDLFRVGY